MNVSLIMEANVVRNHVLHDWAMALTKGNGEAW